MITFTPFKAEHVFQFETQEKQAWMDEYLKLSSMRELENEWATTLWENDKPVLCAGASEIWPGRAAVWALLSTSINRRNFMEVHNLGKAFINGLPFRRCEMYVDVNFKEAHRWARALGFEMEAPIMKAFQVGGGDYAMYAKVKEV